MNPAVVNLKEPEKEKDSLASLQESHADLDMRRLNPRKSNFIIEGKVVKLRNGISEERFGVRSDEKIIRYTGMNSNGDINGDGRNDKIVILSRDPVGSRIFWYAAVIYSENNNFRGSNAILSGDRINVTWAEIDSAKAVISYLDSQPDDPMSSKPANEYSKTLVIESGVLSEIRDLASIQGMKWQWEKTVMSNYEIFIPKRDMAFTLFFGRDGNGFSISQV